MENKNCFVKQVYGVCSSNEVGILRCSGFIYNEEYCWGYTRRGGGVGGGQAPL